MKIKKLDIDIGQGHIGIDYEEAGKSFRTVVDAGDEAKAARFGVEDVADQYWTAEIRARVKTEQRARDAADAKRDEDAQVRIAAHQKRFDDAVAAAIEKQLVR